MGYDHPARIPDALHTGYDNPARIPDALHTGYDNPARTPNFPSRKAEGRGAVCARGAHGTRGGATRAVNGPGLHRQRHVLTCVQSLEDARAGQGGVQPRGRPHANGGVCTQGWCSPTSVQRREDVRAGQGTTRARAAHKTEGGGNSLHTLAPSRLT
ncbi:hypothetical protein BJY52DRAFT_1226409 [Lactarius psammicola]|nr:hypothetical protein BJY52DRAFT_1226409 [Lactarius psammicola]